MSAVGVRKFLFEGNQIAYQKIGDGATVLLAFHGFGQSNQAFSSLETPLGGQFTIFAIDLFFHGNSKYAGSQLLTKADWHRLVAAFLQAHHITRFSLMGFSLGGRFALATVEAFADRVDQLFLIAPDGITHNIWYRLATSSAPGRRLYRYVLRHLTLLSKMGHTLVWFGLLNRSLMRFAERSLSRPKQRHQAYQSWTQFRKIKPDLNAIAKALNNSPVQIQFFIGAFDRIVPGTYILPLTKKLRHYQVNSLPTRHNHLIDLTGAILASAEWYTKARQ